MAMFEWQKKLYAQLMAGGSVIFLERGEGETGRSDITLDQDFIEYCWKYLPGHELNLKRHPLSIEIAILSATNGVDTPSASHYLLPYVQCAGERRWYVKPASTATR